MSLTQRLGKITVFGRALSKIFGEIIDSKYSNDNCSVRITQINHKDESRNPRVLQYLKKWGPFKGLRLKNI